MLTAPHDSALYQETLKQAAKSYFEKGLNVTVARGKDPSCMGPGWHKQTRTFSDIERLIEETPCPTIGFQAGTFSEPGSDAEWLLLMVDIDSPEELEAAKELLGGQIPPCWWSATGRGDRLIFKVAAVDAPAGRASVHYKSTTGARVLVQFGSDGRAAHSVVPPSLHFTQQEGAGEWAPSGREYTWKPGYSPDDLGLPTFPAEAAQKLVEAVEADAVSKRAAEARLEGIERKEGDPLTGVHDRALRAMLVATKDMPDTTDGSKRLFACACRGAEHYLSDACFLATLEEYEARSAPFLKRFNDGERIDRLRQAERQPSVTVGGALAEIFFGEFVSCAFHSLTDDGNADRLVAIADGKHKFVVDSEQWMCWEEQESRWRRTPLDLAVMQLARKGLRPLVLHELEQLQATGDLDGFGDTETRDAAYSGFAKSCANVARVQNAVRFAKGEPAMQVRVEHLDRDPYLLGTPAGVVDLNTGAVRPAQRSDLITKSTLSAVGKADAGARWLRFLDETFQSDREMIGFMQRLLGLSLIGEQREHLLPVWYGKGANGKSVLIDTVSTVLGDYASPMPDGLLTSSKWDRHPTEIASLLGLRLCFAEETSDRAELDEAKVKRLTGGSELRARFMHKDYFSFQPSHTPFLVTNYMPTIHGSDEGIWRRVKVVQFAHTVPQEDRDPCLKEKLLEEGGHILAWMIEGCAEYLESGLREPERVRACTEEYQRDSDPFKRFIGENIVRAPDVFLATADIEKRHERWAEENETLGVHNLARRLRREYEASYTNRDGKRGYKGLALKPEVSFALSA